jgi:hypothetical protein
MDNGLIDKLHYYLIFSVCSCHSFTPRCSFTTQGGSLLSRQAIYYACICSFSATLNTPLVCITISLNASISPAWRFATFSKILLSSLEQVSAERSNLPTLSSFSLPETYVLHAVSVDFSCASCDSSEWNGEAWLGWCTVVGR